MEFHVREFAAKFVELADKLFQFFAVLQVFLDVHAQSVTQKAVFRNNFLHKKAFIFALLFSRFSRFSIDLFSLYAKGGSSVSALLSATYVRGAGAAA